MNFIKYNKDDLLYDLGVLKNRHMEKWKTGNENEKR
jgi:hypothetical protein